MSYELRTRTNSDVPQEVVVGEDSEIGGETHRDGEKVTATPESEDMLDDQVVEQDQHTEEVPSDETPAGDDEAAESRAMTEQSQHEQVYQERLPGALAVPVTTIWPEDALNEMRSRWQAVQLRFVDDPAAATGEMRALVGEAVQALPAVLAERQVELDSWSHSGGHDTEQLRIAVQNYRAFYDFLLGR